MKIFNVRGGLATNSSSLHSLILIPPGETVETDETESFGWQDFTAANKESKSNYLACILHENLRDLIGDSNAGVIVEGLLGVPAANLKSGNYTTYVDHQSRWALPINWDGKGIDLDFFKELQAYILQDEIAILGGNDNKEEDEPMHPLSDHGQFQLPLERDCGPINTVARKDNNHWVLFNRDNGSKVRMAFRGDTEVNVKKAAVPELIDIKITDFCPFGCQYCYQSSTTEGKHGDAVLIRGLAYYFSKMKIFEVAFGGGETTLHPHFVSILEAYRAYNIVPNFTTKNLAWLKGGDAYKILNTCGAFAYSVETAADVEKLVEAIKGIQVNLDNKVSIQYVLGATGNIKEVLEAATKHNLRITLLGFKTTGFGNTFPQVTADDNWIEIVNELRKGHYLKLGVDTAVIQKWGDKIKKDLKVSPTLFTAEEGKFSCYVDTVNLTMAPSSYSDGMPMPLPLQHHSLDEDNFKKVFAMF